MKIPIGKFVIQEYVNEDVLLKYGPDRCLLALDYRILLFNATLQSRYKKKVYINTWFFKGKLSDRGLRVMTGLPDVLSQHYFGRATDSNVEGLTPEEVRVDILKNPDVFNMITRLESGVNWIHADCAYTGQAGISLFNPVK